MAEAAKAAGYTTLGISEHTVLSDDRWDNMRLIRENVEEYFSTINECALREKEIGGLRILSGLECEPLPEYFEFYKEIKEQHKVEFMIIGNHVFPYKGDYVWATGDRLEDQNKIKAYADFLIKGMEIGLFTYVAHPDMFMADKEKWDTYTADVMKNVMRASNAYGVPLEINLNGYRKGLVRRGLNLRYQYQLEEFWALAADEGVRVVVGVDAHIPRDFGRKYPEFDELVKKYDLDIMTEEEVLSKLGVMNVGRMPSP